MVCGWRSSIRWYSYNSSIPIFEKEKFLRLTRTILKDKMARKWCADGRARQIVYEIFFFVIFKKKIFYDPFYFFLPPPKKKTRESSGTW